MVAGLALLLSVLMGSFLLYEWTQSPRLFERLQIVEADAHKNWSQQNLDLAYNGFSELISNIETADKTELNLSRLESFHIFAARISHQNKTYTAAIGHFLKALELNPDDFKTIGLLRKSISESNSSESLDALLSLPTHLLSNIFNDNEFLYTNRYADGWTKGKKSTMLIYCGEAVCMYRTDFFVPGNVNNDALVELNHYGQKIYSKKMTMSEKDSVSLEAKQGISKLDLSIDKVSPLSENDDRLVGFNYSALNPK